MLTLIHLDPRESQSPPPFLLRRPIKTPNPSLLCSSYSPKPYIHKLIPLHRYEYFNFPQTHLQRQMPPPSTRFPSCFRPSLVAGDYHHPAPPPPQPPPPPPISANPNLTAYLYQTDIGLFSLTWSRSITGRSLHVHLQNHPFDSPLPSASLNLHIKPFIFWKKNGFKMLSPNALVFWNFSGAKFGSGPEPKSGFYVAVVVNNEMVLLVGDSVKEAFAKTKCHEPKNAQFMVLKREHVITNKIYNTRAKFGGKIREIQIDCGYLDETRLCFSVDNKKVLQIKRLKWKFRGNERVEVDGVPIHISWDVYNWLFDNENNDGHAIFMFKFEEEDGEEQGKGSSGERNLMNSWMHQNWDLGVNGGYGWGKTGKSLSLSSVSMSSSAGSFGGSSSVMEWASTEEHELVGPVGFSLVVYAWKRSS